MPMMALSLIPQHAVPVKGFMMAKMGVVYVIRNDEYVANRFKVGQTYDLEKHISGLNSSIFLKHTFNFIILRGYHHVKILRYIRIIN